MIHVHQIWHTDNWLAMPIGSDDTGKVIVAKMILAKNQSKKTTTNPPSKVVVIQTQNDGGRPINRLAA
jgi:hypothetical protein